jgi:hypothetical protein
VDNEKRMENYVRQAFTRQSGHECDLLTYRLEENAYMIGCPRHGYHLIRYPLTAQQQRRVRRKAATQ